MRPRTRREQAPELHKRCRLSTRSMTVVAVLVDSQWSPPFVSALWRHSGTVAQGRAISLELEDCGFRATSEWGAWIPRMQLDMVIHRSLFVLAVMGLALLAASCGRSPGSHVAQL